MARSGKIGDRSMEQAQTDREQVQKSLREIQNNIEKQQSNVTKLQDHIRKAREDKIHINEKALKIRSDMQKVKQLRDKLLELGAKESQLEIEIRCLKGRLNDADNELADAIKKQSECKQKVRQEKEEAGEIKMQNASLLRELKNVQIEVENYINAKIEDNLSIAEEKLEQVLGDDEKIKENISKLEKTLRGMEDELSGQEFQKLDLRNNLELIDKEADIKMLAAEVSKLEEKKKTFNVKELEREYNSLKQRREKFEQEQSIITGKKQELEDTIRNLKYSVLIKDKYKNAREDHKKERLNMIVQKEAIDNLRAYITVLDKSMIQYHSERMNTVNNIMANLWKLVYSGNDTNTIKIQVDETGKIGTGRRTYNYKLVQVKRGAEMDMKGRCSAGQKVLASIIIRMALAETFCGNCAVLALDEPTTNLDDEHATNLARTLSKVIQHRSRLQNNFQLVVISHDEKFITNLSNMSGRQLYHELYRNDEGLTMIRQKDQAMGAQSDDEDEEDNNYARSRKRQADSSPPYVRSQKKRAVY